MNYENICSAVQYLCVFHDIQRNVRENIFGEILYQLLIVDVVKNKMIMWDTCAYVYMYVHFYTSMLYIARLPTCVYTKMVRQQTLTSERN